MHYNVLNYWSKFQANLTTFQWGFFRWIGNQGLDFAETFQSSLLSRQETAVSIFCSDNLSFRQNQLKKFEISTFSPVQRNFTIFC